MAVAASARRHVQHAVAAECHARAARRLRTGDEHVVRVAQRTPVPAAARDCDGGIFRADRFAVGEIDVTVGRELRMQRDVHEPRQPFGTNLRHAGDGLGVELAAANRRARSPARSVTRIVSLATNARPHGCANPRVTTATSMFWPFGRLVAHGLPRAAAAR